MSTTDLNPLPGRRLLWAMALLMVVGLAVLLLLSSSGETPSAQPIRFSHKAHFEEVTCEGCHLHVMEIAAAGTPTLEDCLDCHDGVQSEKPEDVREEEKIEIYAEAEREIPWVRSTSLAPHAYFSHRRHASLAEIECAHCHGAIAETEALPSKRPQAFTMNWCRDCHEEHEATLDCVICHR